MATNTEPRILGIGRVIEGEIVFVPVPDYEAASDYHTGCLLRIRNQPIEACSNRHQRRGWRVEHCRQTYKPKPRKWDFETVTPDDLPY
jgi:hypothetical protein